MHPRATELIGLMRLVPHPEGGYFSEVFRPLELVGVMDERQTRCAVTTIFFLLGAGQQSRWHRVRSAEVWHYYEGDPLELVSLDLGMQTKRSQPLGPVGDGRPPVFVVPAGWWQAARPTGECSLAGCTVAPGLEYEDFSMMQDAPDVAGRLVERHPELAALL